MIVLDTNVISETFRPNPHLAVKAWFDAQVVEALFICAPVLAEMRFGIERLASGAQQRWLSNEADRLENYQFRGKVLPFDAQTASIYGRITAERERRGQPMGPMDAMIAAIALQHNAVIATRDIRGFAIPGLIVVNPFDINNSN